MELRVPQRSPSYLPDLYQNMVRGEEAKSPKQLRQDHQPLRSSSTSAISSTLAKREPQPSHLQSSTTLSCDPHLRPIIRRRARSLPTSPERLKSTAVQCRAPGCSRSRINRVRFADALGLELAEVKVFQVGEDPFVPLHVLSRLSINSDLCCSQLDMELTIQCLEPDFQQPADCVDFSTRLQQQQVCLERVSSSDLGLSGTIQVLNVAFEKQVSVRYTFNQWKSVHEVCAHWHSSSLEDDGKGQADVFTFFLPMPPFLLQLCSVVQFAVRYRVNGQEYWDNNQGQNYSFTCRSHPLKMPRECEESWIHFI